MLADSGISLSSPPANQKHFSHLNEDEEEAILEELCITDDEGDSDVIQVDQIGKAAISDNEESSSCSKSDFEQFRRTLPEKQIHHSDVSDVTPSKRARKSYVCDVCQKEFRGKSDLSRHKLIHTAERPYECRICGNKYRQEINLKNHITSAHNKQKEFACKECPKKFALKERLRLHMRIHTGEKPYACSLCDKRFARGGQVKLEEACRLIQAKTLISFTFS